MTRRVWLPVRFSWSERLFARFAREREAADQTRKNRYDETTAEARLYPRRESGTVENVVSVGGRG